MELQIHAFLVCGHNKEVIVTFESIAEMTDTFFAKLIAPKIKITFYFQTERIMYIVRIYDTVAAVCIAKYIQ